MDKDSFGSAVPDLLTEPGESVLAGKIHKAGARNLYSEIALVNLSPAPTLLYRVGILHDKGESFADTFVIVPVGTSEVCFSGSLHTSWLDAMDADNRSRFLAGPDHDGYQGIVTLAVEVSSAGHVRSLRWRMRYQREGEVHYFLDAR